MKPGQIMYYNWNRMVLIGKLKKQTKDIINERHLRTNFQNRFALEKTDANACAFAINTVKKTITLDIIKSVDKYMK